MNTRYFNGAIMPPLNHYWAASVLNMRENPGKGPDLVDEKKAVELKFKVVYEREYTHKCWRTLEHQLDYNKIERPAFWGLGFYTLSKLARVLRNADIRILERLIKTRELYIVEWHWMQQFPPYVEKGEGKEGKYENTLRFPKFSKLPQVVSSREVKKGRIHFTSGVPKHLFS